MVVPGPDPGAPSDSPRPPLAEQEERLRLALAAANQGLYDLDVPAGVATVSPEYATMLGLDPDGFRETRAAWLSRLHPDDLPPVARAWQEYLHGRRTEHRLEFRQRSRSGTWKWILSLGKVVARTPDGRPLRLLGTHTDITERKLAEEALRQTTDRLSHLLTAGPMIVYALRIVGERLVPVSVSHNVERILGYTAAEALHPKWWVDHIHPEDRTEAIVRQLELFQRGHLTHEYRFYHKDGRALWTHDHLRLIRGPDGAPREIVGAWSDISERKETEQALRLQSAALSAAANAIVITDLEGRIEWANPAFTAVTGYTLAEALGRNPRDLIRSGTHDAEFYRALWQTLLAGKVWHGEITNRRKDGTLYPEEMTITPVRGASGRIGHFIAIKRDLSEKKRLEAQFLQAQKMEVVGRLAGGVAHDFNNLLTVINATAGLAARSLDAGHPLEEELQVILGAGERAATITRQLLAFSRTAGRAREPIDLRALLGDLRQMLQRLLGEDIVIHLTGDPDLGAVLGDSGEMTQVILNLAVNARDAMPAGGSLTFETRNLPPGEARLAAGNDADAAPGILLAVRDTGHGMTEEIQRRIFEPFFTTKEPHKGTGLGLATVYGIVAQSGGTVEVESSPGNGATFRIHLPRVPDSTPAGHQVNDQETVEGRETILLVEDDAALRSLATRILQRAGYHVLAAADAPQARRIFAAHSEPVDLLLTDVVLPGMSGPDLADLLTGRAPGLKVLYTSGYNDNLVLRDKVLDGGTDFLGKPWSVGSLTRKVREVLDGGGRLDG